MATSTGYRTKKRFGQHFLHERRYIDAILAAADLDATSRVVEIGPGMGALTLPMLACVGELHVIEIDRDLIDHYRQQNLAGLQLHAGDALRLDWRELLPNRPYTLVSNLPYNISSQILFKLLDERSLFSQAVLMFQKEVAERICAEPGTRDYGILSVLCQMWFEVRKVITVPAGAFSPPPKVESAVVALTPRPQPLFPLNDEAFFRKVVKLAFAQRRKTLRNNLRAAGFDAEALEQACDVCGVDAARRGETLTLKEFSLLAQALLDVSSTLKEK